jgi:ABC-type thiamine transport system substrate-binding protein
MRVPLEEVESVLLQHKVEDSQSILNDLQKIMEELKAEKDSDPKPKYEHLIVLHDPENKLTGQEFTGWVVQQEEGEDAGAVLSKITDAARTSNDNAKKKKLVIKTMVDAFKYLKPKWIKEKKVKIKTKEEVRVLINNGELV